MRSMKRSRQDDEYSDQAKLMPASSSFYHQKKLNTNNSSGSDSESRSFTCEQCGKSFASSSGLKQHMHIHGSVKPYKCDVNYFCKLNFFKEEKIYLVVVVVSFQICSKAYTQFSNLCRHKRSHAAEAKSQNFCRTCRTTFQSSIALAKHE